MAEQTLTYRNDSLILNEAYEYALLVLVNGNSFSYAVTSGNQLMAYEANCPLSELTNPSQLQELLEANYKKIVLALPSPGFSLLPVNLFNADRLTDIAHLLDVKENEKVLAQVLDKENYIVYKVDEQLLAVVNRYDTKNVVFAAKGWIKAIAEANPANNQLYVNVEGNKADFLYFKDAGIRFYNSFEAKSADDVAYYAALVAGDLELHPELTRLIVSGDITAGDEIHTSLSRFFLAVTINPIQLLELPEQLSHHQLLSLAALSLCESSEAL